MQSHKPGRSLFFASNIYETHKSVIHEYLLAQSNSILLQSKHIVSKDYDLIIPSFMEFNQELASPKFVWVHGIEQYPLLCFYSYIFSVEFRRHWTPNLQLYPKSRYFSKNSSMRLQ